MDLSLATIVLWAVPVVFAITLHEAAHGYVAKLFGDHTAEMLGRITLNPLKHVDPVATILVPGMVLALEGRIGFPATAHSGPGPSAGLFEMADIGFKVNLVLMALNLLPLPPLDG